MIQVAALLLSVAAGFAALASSAADEHDELPSLQMVLRRIELMTPESERAVSWMSNTEGTGKEGWSMELVWTFPQFPGWKIYRCKDKPVRVMMEDSAGRKAPGVSYVSRDIDRRIVARMGTRGWMPSAGAQWIRVKGKIPVVVSCREGVTELVTVKLVEGASVPLVLKGAGMGKDGRAQDVKARLLVRHYRDEQPYGEEPQEDKKELLMEVEADMPVGIREVELQTVKGQPVVAKDGMERMRALLRHETMANAMLRLSFPDESVPAASEASGCWGPKVLSKRWSIDPVKAGELKVSVRYSQNLQRHQAVIDHRVSLSGAVSEKDGKKSGEDCPSPETERPLTVGVRPCPGGMMPGGNGVSAMLDSLSVGSKYIWTEKASAVRMKLGLGLAVKAPAVFGTRADKTEQTLEVTDSTGRVLAPVVFDLTWLHSRITGEGMALTRIEGECPELASPGAAWLRVKGVLRVPLVVIKKGPVYELPLQKGIELQIPVPGMADDDGAAHDVAALEDMFDCRLILEDLEKQGPREMKVRVVLAVENIPFDLDCFELVDDKDVPLKNVEVTGCSSLYNVRKTQLSWSREFTMRDAANVKKLRVRLKYKSNRETVGVPVDCKVGLGGPVPQKSGYGK